MLSLWRIGWTTPVRPSAMSRRLSPMLEMVVARAGPPAKGLSVNTLRSVLVVIPPSLYTPRRRGLHHERVHGGAGDRRDAHVIVVRALDLERHLLGRCAGAPRRLRELHSGRIEDVDGQIGALLVPVEHRLA